MDSVSGQIFEIEDFTASTEWEKFMVNLEAAMLEWDTNDRKERRVISKGCYQTGRWVERSECVRFGKTEFNIVLTKLETHEVAGKIGGSGGKTTHNISHIPHALLDTLDSGNDFCTSCVPHISRWFGIGDYVLVHAKTDTVFNEDRTNHLLMSFTTAALNASCHLPIFCLADDPKRSLYFGVCVNNNMRSDFRSVHLRHCPIKLTHLSGLLAIFKEKVACPICRPPPVKVSIQMNYVLHESTADSKHWTLPNSQQTIAPSLFHLANNLPFGMEQDPLHELRLHCVWPSVNEDMIVENDVYSDLTPQAAPVWNSSVSFKLGAPCLLQELLKCFLLEYRSKQTVNSHLGLDESGPETALSRLTQTPAERALNLPKRPSRANLPLNETFVQSAINEIFGMEDNNESDGESEHNSTPQDSPRKYLNDKVPGGAIADTKPREEGEDRDDPEDKLGSPSNHPFIRLPLPQEKISSAKSAPLDSMTCRLSVVLCGMRSSMQGMTAVCQVWREFVLTLRQWWEDGRLIPGIAAEDRPDLGTCLLHQKLSMLQCCIMAKNKRAKLLERQDSKSSGNSESDSFYDCLEENIESDKCLDEKKPRGRLTQLTPTEYLQAHPDTKIYVPVTQDASPMTEDMIEEQMHLFDEMGTDEEAVARRSRMQAASLNSDMQAFKAANPGCDLLDFVIWHSPRDCIREGDKKACLSERMLHSGNVWLETWNNASSVPVSKQPRLFDESKEAEKILHHLEDISINDMIRLILPPLFTVALNNVCYEAGPVQSLIKDKLDECCSSFPRVVRLANPDSYLDLIKMIGWMESTVSQFRALKARFENVCEEMKKEIEREQLNLDVLTMQLMQLPIVPLFGGAMGASGTLFRHIFCRDSRINHVVITKDRLNRMPAYTSKEYIFRWLVARPSVQSRPCPQRMYAFIDKQTNFRLATVFSQDTTFFV